MLRQSAESYVSFVVDDAGSGRELSADPHAIIRAEDFRYRSVLVGWQCGFEPLFVAVHSYLDCELNDDEAAGLAADYLAERNWFADQPTDPDYIIR